MIRARMDDVDRDVLPSVAAVRQVARDAAGSADTNGDATCPLGPLPPELEARFDDWMPAPSGAPVDWQAVDQASSAQGTWADWQQAEGGQGSDQRESFTHWERFARSMRAFKQGALDKRHHDNPRQWGSRHIWRQRERHVRSEGRRQFDLYHQRERRRHQAPWQQ